MGDEAESIKYKEVFNYLSGYEYPSSATKAEKGSIRKRAKKFTIANGLLHYKDQTKDGQLQLKQVSDYYAHECSQTITSEGCFLVRW